MHMLHVCVTMCAGVHGGRGPPGAGVTISCELLAMITGNQT